LRNLSGLERACKDEEHESNLSFPAKTNFQWRPVEVNMQKLGQFLILKQTNFLVSIWASLLNSISIHGKKSKWTERFFICATPNEWIFKRLVRSGKSFKMQRK
jgi:hypothetical protein